VPGERIGVISFFGGKRLLPGLAGIEFGADGVSVVRVVRQAGRAPVVEACDFRAWSDGDKERVLAKLASDYDLKRTRCTTVLDIDDYTLLLTEAPDVPVDELRSAVRWRIKDLVDFHVDDATIDVFDVTSAQTHMKQRQMYVVAAKNAAIQRRVALCDAAEIHLDVIDIPELAQRNIASVLPDDIQGVVLLSLSGNRGLITITRQGEMYLSRRLELGINQLQGGEDERTLYLEQIVLEVQRSLDYYDSHFRQPPVAQLVLSPTAQDVPGLIDYLNQNLNVKSSVLNLTSTIKCDATRIDLLQDRALIALGAALRHEEKAL
jgi:MSHA biogenesis protein MshI